ncbi:MAG: spondin domain-containing protein [Actinomycetota bacterium]
MKRLGIVAIAVASLAALLSATGAAASTGHSGRPDATYRVTVTNTTDGQYLTPPNFAAHEPGVRIFRRGQQASPGVQAVAENGGVPVLAQELTDAGIDNGVVGSAPIPPGESATFEITTNERRFSVVSMIICTNDGFGGVNSVALPGDDGDVRTVGLRSYDAGTEINTEARGDIVPAPFCGEGEGSGETDPALAENGTISRHRGIQGVGDFGPEFDFGRFVGEVTIERLSTTPPPSPVYSITFRNETSGQYLTPPNVVLHDRSADVWSRRAPASPGVQAVAENGGVPVLAAEIAGAVDDAGLGDSTVGGDGPLAPGAEVTFELGSSERQLSIVSMLICTNDGFAGLDSRNIGRLDVGESSSFNLRGYDAGTEINTELRADLVPAPFCGEGDGSTESNPELAEDNVIRRHRGIQGVGDLGPEFDWNNPVASVTITRIG